MGILDNVIPKVLKPETGSGGGEFPKPDKGGLDQLKKAKSIDMEATAYGPPWGGIEGGGKTAGGTDLSKSPHKLIIAISQHGSPLKMGDTVVIQPNPHNNTIAPFKVDDHLGGQAPSNQIDIYMWQGRAAQNAWGKRRVKVYPIKGGAAEAGAQGGANAIPDPLKDLATAIVNIFRKLFDPQTWLDIGKILLGVVAVLMGVSMLIKGSATSLITQPPARAARAIVAAGQAAA